MNKAELSVRLKKLWGNVKVMRERCPEELKPELRDLIKSFLPIGWELFKRVNADGERQNPELEIQEWI